MISIKNPLWVKIVAGITSLVLCFYFLFINYTEPTELGIARNSISGEIWIQERGGWHLTSPFVLVSVLDMRPMRVAVLSAGHGYCAKLAQFDKTYWREFIATEGFRYYWFANRISFNFGYDEEYRGQKDLMRGYAFSVKKYPFIKIITEYQ
jgi:hypothetical protein